MNNVVLAQVTQIDVSKQHSFKGLLGEDGEYYMAIVDFYQQLGFNNLTTARAKIGQSLEIDSDFVKVQSPESHHPFSTVTLDEFEICLQILAEEGNVKAQEIQTARGIKFEEKQIDTSKKSKNPILDILLGEIIDISLSDRHNCEGLLVDQEYYVGIFQFCKLFKIKNKEYFHKEAKLLLKIANNVENYQFAKVAIKVDNWQLKASPPFNAIDLDDFERLVSSLASLGNPEAQDFMKAIGKSYAIATPTKTPTFLCVVADEQHGFCKVDIVSKPARFLRSLQQHHPVPLSIYFSRQILNFPERLRSLQATLADFELLNGWLDAACLAVVDWDSF